MKVFEILEIKKDLDIYPLIAIPACKLNFWLIIFSTVQTIAKSPSLEDNHIEKLFSHLELKGFFAWHANFLAAKAFTMR
jgi:hypothetical protein